MMKTKASTDLLDLINEIRDNMGSGYRGMLLIEYDTLSDYVEKFEKLERQLEKLENKKLTCKDE